MRVLALFALSLTAFGAEEQDILLRAMRDELGRSKQLRLVDLDTPYYIDYRVEDAHLTSVAASLGALLGASDQSIRIPSVTVRLGDYKFDNTDHVYSDYYTGSRYDSDQLPLEDNYLALRQAFWLSTDRAYKRAEEAIARKRSAMKSVNLPEQLPDFSKAEPVRSILPGKPVPVNVPQWKQKIVSFSSLFAGYPQILSSTVDFEASQSVNYFVNSEGSEERYPEELALIRVRASAQAADGTLLRDAMVFQGYGANDLPVEADVRRGITQLAENLSALARAPKAEAYDGPVLFEPAAAAQLFGQLLGDNLKITRKPIPDPGRAVPYAASELENRVGSRILPEWMDVVDDPAQTEWQGQKLFGHYLFDLQGIQPKPLTLIEKGVLKSFLLTRTPVIKGFESSNGRARMPGSFGTSGPGFGNLFVRASQTTSLGDLKKKLIELAQQRQRPYGLLVRKMDFPSSATVDELRRSTSAASQSGGNTRPVSQPILVFKVYPDGHEELVRGLRFRGLSTRSFKDITAASDEVSVLNFLDSPVPFALMGVGGFVTNAAVIAPGILFEELETEVMEEEVPKPPVVPPPTLTTAKAQS